MASGLGPEGPGSIPDAIKNSPSASDVRARKSPVVGHSQFTMGVVPGENFHRVRGSPGGKQPYTLMAPGACKSVVGAMISKFPSKLCFWGYQSRGAIPSMAYQNCDGMSPDHPSGRVPDHQQ